MMLRLEYNVCCKNFFETTNFIMKTVEILGLSSKFCSKYQHKSSTWVSIIVMYIVLLVTTSILIQLCILEYQLYFRQYINLINNFSSKDDGLTLQMATAASLTDLDQTITTEQWIYWYAFIYSFNVISIFHRECTTSETVSTLLK